MVFVIPSKSKQTFKWQSDLADIAQYVSMNNEVASEELIRNSSKKRKVRIRVIIQL